MHGRLFPVLTVHIWHAGGLQNHACPANILVYEVEVHVKSWDADQSQWRCKLVNH